MKLTLQQIESVFLHDEREKKISPAVWSLLYFAARSDGIGSMDALRVIVREPSDVSMLVENMLAIGDVDEVKKLSDAIGLEMSSRDSDRATTKRILDAWVAKTVMKNVADAARRRNSGVDES